MATAKNATVQGVITGLRNRRGSTSGRLLDDGVVCARVRAWSGRPDIAHLVLTDHSTAPSLASLKEWIDALGRENYSLIRTGALSTPVGEFFETFGFHIIQELALLRMVKPILDSSGPSQHQTRAMRSVRSLETAARLDKLAFAAGWELDVPAIHAACTATPSHRIRLAITSADEPAGYMITGRNGTAGFIQRLAVDPKFAGQGVATSLLNDGVMWLTKNHVQDILVNTELDNDRALTLYERLGFKLLPTNLCVMEMSLPSQDYP